MSDELDADRGRQAQEVLDNAIYAETYTLIELEICNAWQKSRDKQEREELHQLLRMLEKTRNVLESTMRRGKLAADSLQKKRSLAERVGLRHRPS